MHIWWLEIQMSSHHVCMCMHTYVQFWMDNGLEKWFMSVAVVPTYWNYTWYACHFPTPLSLTCGIILVHIVSHTIWGIILTYQLCHSICTIDHTASIRLQSDHEGEYHSIKADESDARSTLRTNIVVKYRTWPPAHVQLKCDRYCWQSCLQQVFQNIDMTRVISMSPVDPLDLWGSL